MKTQLLKKSLVIVATGAALFGCEKTSDVGPVAEYGIWKVDHYTDFNLGFVGASADAATICAYKGDGVNNYVYLDMDGTVTAQFKKNGSSNWNAKIDGRSLTFANPPAGYQEEKGTTKLYRQYDPSQPVVAHNVSITAGNEAAINIIPKTDFVVASHDPVAGRTKLTFTQKREKRYIRIRTDYTTIARDSNGNVIYDSYGQPMLGIATDLYQVDCGSSAREAAVAGAKAAAPTLVKTHSAIILGKNARPGDAL